MYKYFKKISVSLSAIFFAALPTMVLAESEAYKNLETVGQGEGGGYAPANQYKLAEIAGTAIQAFLGLLGIIFLVYMLYAGYSWMTAQGDEEKVTKAKDTLSRAIIGLIVIIAASAITWFVIMKIGPTQLK